MGGSRGIGEDTDQQFPPMGSLKSDDVWEPQLWISGSQKKDLAERIWSPGAASSRTRVDESRCRIHSWWTRLRPKCLLLTTPFRPQTNLQHIYGVFRASSHFSHHVLLLKSHKTVSVHQPLCWSVQAKKVVKVPKPRLACQCWASVHWEGAWHSLIIFKPKEKSKTYF